MSISSLQMVLAAVGLIPPYANAVMQEMVDLGAVLNGLRVLTF
jgi:hypothetical protein